jgi:putative NIF3 family GTP cyclohydrolase 1 type 2
MIGELNESISEKDFLGLLKERLGAGLIRHSRLLGREIRKVAFCGGAGSFLIHEALAHGAHAFVTSDVKYHQFFDADGKMLIADVGHYESEQFTKDLILQLLKEKFPNFALQISKVNTNAVYYFS